MSCDTKISLSNYHDLIKNPSDDPWICTLCEISSTDHPASSPGDPSELNLSCICFHARSIVSKRFDFLAFL